MDQESDDLPESPRRRTTRRLADRVREWIPLVTTVVMTGVAVYGAVAGHGPSQ
ncbi:hypothetical protein [Streptomyces sp. SID3343]|uniref:hypothetical protein n=1 Tax=Streptomyces sp. SID3343 TaxID=2690260 RepID=UPI00136DABE1|nr:hypothetical protein [Streptomyces sp. SID3343]